MEWETVIGLEIHAQLKTESKIFSGSSTAYGGAPNTQANLVDLGFPGVLPVLNKEAVRMAAVFGLAVDAQVAPHSVFARKNYFYPDLPKGYQISQFELPIVAKGRISIDLEEGEKKTIRITRAHLEEDAGKSLHEDFSNASGIDLNRAGTPLLEIVSEPDLRSAKEAVAYMKKIHSIVQYLDINDGNLQEGSFRCDANVSVRPVGQEEFGTRTEIKNLNSFRFVEKAINYEIERQIDVLEDGGRVVQETRLYDADKDQTRTMRGKEEANDYRYFPDPDLLPVAIEPEYLERLAASLPELPDQKRNRYILEFGLSDYDAGVLTASRDLAEYYEATCQNLADEPKLVANWVMGSLTAALNRDGINVREAPVTPSGLALLIGRIVDETISGKLAKDVFEAMWNGEGDADTVIDKRGLKQITDASEIEAIVDEIIQKFPEQLAEYQSGKEKLLGFFVGQVMKATQGKANPGQVNQLLKSKLKS